MRGKRFVRPILLKCNFSFFDNLSSLLEKTLQWKVRGEIALKCGRATSCDMEIISVYAMKTKYHERNFDTKCAFSDAYLITCNIFHRDKQLRELNYQVNRKSSYN